MKFLLMSFRAIFAFCFLVNTALGEFPFKVSPVNVVGKMDKNVTLTCIPEIDADVAWFDAHWMHVSVGNQITFTLNKTTTGIYTCDFHNENRSFVGAALVGMTEGDLLCNQSGKLLSENDLLTIDCVLPYFGPYPPSLRWSIEKGKYLEICRPNNGCDVNPLKSIVINNTEGGLLHHTFVKNVTKNDKNLVVKVDAYFQPPEDWMFRALGDDTEGYVFADNVPDLKLPSWSSDPVHLKGSVARCRPLEFPALLIIFLFHFLSYI